jgi:hypothetical protein
MAVSPSLSRHWLRARKRRLHRNGSASQRVLLVWCGGGCPTTCCAVRRPVRCPTCPVSNVSGFACPVTGVRRRVTGVRFVDVQCPRVSCPRPTVGAVVGSWSELVAGGSAGERPAADRQQAPVATTGAVGHLAAWHRNPSGGRLVWAASHGLKRRDGPWFRTGRMASPARRGDVWRRTRRVARIGVVTTLSGHRVKRGAEPPGLQRLPGFIATRACGRRAAATCSERRPREADDALTCEFGGGGEGI